MQKGSTSPRDDRDGFDRRDSRYSPRRRDEYERNRGRNEGRERRGEDERKNWRDGPASPRNDRIGGSYDERREGREGYEERRRYDGRREEEEGRERRKDYFDEREGERNGGGQEERGRGEEDVGARAEAFLTKMSSGPRRGEWAEGWVSKGPPAEGSESAEREDLKDNVNDVLVKSVFHGWNTETVRRMRQSLAERLNRTWINVWAEDPPEPVETEPQDSDKSGRTKDKRKASRSKDKSSRRAKEKRHRKSRRKSHSSDSDSDSSSDSYHQRRREKRKRKEKKRKRDDYDYEEETEKDQMLMDESKREEYELMQEMLAKKRKLAEANKVEEKQGEEDDEDMMGPSPLRSVSLAKGYGSAMLPGEADAMAQFVQDNKRIPRRGEIGLTAEEIEKYESLGYQMSGSRHRRMNAVRIRKEGQIYSADEQRILAQINAAERAKRENVVVADFRQLLSSKVKEAAAESSSKLPSSSGNP